MTNQNPYNCTLFNCKSLNKLSKLLCIDTMDEFNSLANKLDTNPMQFYSSFYNKNKRLVFSIKDRQINNLHKRLIKLFNVNIPTYLKGGIKKQSNITNAKFHQNNKHFLLLDIKGFYPSVTKSKIETQLMRTYQMSKDVARFISLLITIPQVNKKGQTVRALVTGSPLSTFFAFAINKKMFDELDKLSKTYAITYTVFVDDISFSSKATIPYKFNKIVNRIITKFNYQIHQGKLYRGKISDKTIITGVRKSKYGLRLKVEHKEKITNLLKKDSITTKEKDTLIGLIGYAQQINPKYSKLIHLIKESKEVD